ncbi:hypothetical protein P8452_47446 [Trifolium repens]|nr:hypothetical protein P8452_47446 [Trifolium repens]
MALAMQSGIGFSKIILMFATCYTSTLLLKNGKLSELIGEIQLLVKRLENYENQAEGEGEMDDAIAAQVRRLIKEVQELASNSNRPITVLNGGSGQSNSSSLVVSVAALGVAGYGYIWWKGLSFSDIMFVTKHNMEKAVADLTKKLQHASDVIAHAKKHLTQRIKNLADKVDKQEEISKKIHADVTKVGNTLTDVHDEVGNLQLKLETLHERANKLLENQDYANNGIDYVINIIRTYFPSAPGSLQGSIRPEQPKLPGRSPAMITYPGIQGLKVIVESLSSLDRSASDTIMPGSLDKLEQQQSPLSRFELAQFLFLQYFPSYEKVPNMLAF